MLLGFPRVEDEGRLDDVPAFLAGKVLFYWCSIEEYAPELRPENWEGFIYLMLARFSGQTVGSTIANLQRVRYDGDFELLAESFAEVFAKRVPSPSRPSPRLVLKSFPNRDA